MNDCHSWPLFGILVPAPEHDLVPGEGKGRNVVYVEPTSMENESGYLHVGIIGCDL